MATLDLYAMCFPSLMIQWSDIFLWKTIIQGQNDKYILIKVCYVDCFICLLKVYVSSNGLDNYIEKKTVHQTALMAN